MLYTKVVVESLEYSRIFHIDMLYDLHIANIYVYDSITVELVMQPLEQLSEH